MEVTPELMPRDLIAKKPVELVDYYQSITKNISPEQQHGIVDHMIAQVHGGLIPPAIFRIWLPLILHRLPSLLRRVLLDPKSHLIRKAGIQALNQGLSHARTRKTTWDALGGTSGVLDIFRTVGSKQARHLAQIIGKKLRKPSDLTREIDILVQSLLSDASYPENDFHLGLTGEARMAMGTHDSEPQKPRRLCFSDIHRLIGACSEQFILVLFSLPREPDFPLFNFLNRLAESRTDLLRRIAVGSTSVDPSVRVQILKRLPIKLLTSAELYTPQLSPTSQTSQRSIPGLLFTLDLFSSLCDESIPATELEHSMLCQWAIRSSQQWAAKKVPFDDILALLEAAAVVVLDRIGEREYLWNSFSAFIAQLWAISIGSATDVELESYRAAGNHFTSGPPRPLSKHTERLENIIIRFLQGAPGPFYSGNILSFLPDSDDFPDSDPSAEQEDLSSCFPLGAKLRLCKLISSHLPSSFINLNAMPPRQNDWIYLLENSNSFTDSFSIEDSKWLLDKIASLGLTDKLHPNFDLLPYGDSKWVYRGLLKVRFEAEGLSSGKTDTLAFIEDLKKRAERERHVGCRESWSTRVIQAAVATNNIQLFGDVSKWTARFMRDPDVYPPLAKLLWGEEYALFLSCTNLSPKWRPTSLEALNQRVKGSNLVLSTHIHAALAALQEPSYERSPLQDPNQQLTEVLALRLKGVREYFRAGLAKEEALAEVLLDSMIPVLLEYEAIALTKGNEALRWHCMTGPLDQLNCPTPVPGYALAFLDKLARQRDELWESRRRLRQPTSAKLGLGWPKGLPIQALIPNEEWASAIFVKKGAAPFLAARLDEVLFCDAELAVSKIPSKTRGIGKYVDSLPFVIDAYCNSKVTPRRSSRILKIWNHYKTILPARSRYLESVRQHLSDYSYDHSLGYTVQRELLSTSLCELPNPKDSAADTPISWYPCQDAPNTGDDFMHVDDEEDEDDAEDAEGEEGDDGSGTLLDCRLSACPSYSVADDFYTTFEEPVIEINQPEASPTELWSPKLDVRKIPLQNQEAIVVSALLYLDTLGGRSSGILAKEFPEDAVHPRYPALKLDRDFLTAVEEDSQAISTALKALSLLISIVPSNLLQDLSFSLLKRLSTTSNPTTIWILQSTAARLLSMMAKSDQPVAVLVPGIYALKHLPDMSAYHRRILSRPLLQELDFSDAEHLFERFLSFILDSLKKSPDSSEASTSDATSEAPLHVKISTIKLLPELIGGGKFFASPTALRVLERLFHACGHIDVRAVVLTTLLQLLKDSVDLDGNASTEVYGLVASFYKAASGPNERETIFDEDWEASEQGRALPELFADHPLFNILLDAHDSIPESAREDYVQNVLFPLLEESTAQHNRWMRIFLGKFGISNNDIPVSTFGPFVYQAENLLLTKWISYLPKEYLLRHRAWALRYLDCCKLTFVEQKFINVDPDWKATNSGRHWSKYMSKYSDCAAFDNDFRQFLNKDFCTKVRNGISREDIIHEYIERSKIVLRNPVHIGDDGKQRTSLKEIRWAYESYDGLFKYKQSPWRRIYEAIAADFATLHTPSWIQDPNRKPSILPSEMKIKTLLLPYPYHDKSSTPDYGSFVRAVLELVEESAKSMSCIQDLDYFEQAIYALPDKIQNALLIGSIPIEEHESLTGYIKVHLSTHLLDCVLADEIQRNDEVKTMLESWAISPNEQIRMTARELDQRLEMINPEL